MKSFTWQEEDCDEVLNGHYECKLHDKENCPVCTDVAIEKPLSWTITKQNFGIAGKRSKLDDVFENIFGHMRGKK